MYNSKREVLKIKKLGLKKKFVFKQVLKMSINGELFDREREIIPKFGGTQ